MLHPVDLVKNQRCVMMEKRNLINAMFCKIRTRALIRQVLQLVNLLKYDDEAITLDLNLLLQLSSIFLNTFFCMIRYIIAPVALLEST